MPNRRKKVFCVMAEEKKNTEGHVAEKKNTEGNVASLQIGSWYMVADTSDARERFIQTSYRLPFPGCKYQVTSLVRNRVNMRTNHDVCERFALHTLVPPFLFMPVDAHHSLVS